MASHSLWMLDRFLEWPLIVLFVRFMRIKIECLHCVMLANAKGSGRVNNDFKRYRK